jgi:hypothetical protein
MVDLPVFDVVNDRTYGKCEFPSDDWVPKPIGTSPWRYLSLHEDLPAVPAVYIAIARPLQQPPGLIISGGRTVDVPTRVPTRVIYVGSTGNLSARMNSHRAMASRSTSHWLHTYGISMKYRVSLRYGDWTMIELRLIRRLRPAHNKRGA